MTRTRTVKQRNLVLYRAYDEAGVLLYVGRSIRVWERIAAHQQGSPFFDLATRITLQRGFKSERDLDDAERAAIYAERPRFNKNSRLPVLTPSRVEREPVCPDCPPPGHHCRKPPTGEYHDLATCRERDEKDRAIADRLDEGVSAEAVAAEFGCRAATVVETHAEVRRELAAGVHGCWEHDDASDLDRG